MMKSKLMFLGILSFLLISCSKKKENHKYDYNKGDLTILVDESFKSVTEALAEAYTINYPDSNVKVVVKKEDFAFLDLLHQKAKLIVMSRDLSLEEKSEYERITQLKFNPAKFAADGVVFIVPKSSARESLSYEEIASELASDDKDLIFDGTNSGNLNFVAQTYHKKPADLKFSIIRGNENIVYQLNKYPNKIGVISLNTISRPYSAEAEKLRSMIKILPITKDGKSYEPSQENLKKMVYPFTRVLYFLSDEGGFGIANGVMRYSCTQLGQMVVEKEGLQPYNIFKREVQMR